MPLLPVLLPVRSSCSLPSIPQHLTRLNRRCVPLLHRPAGRALDVAQLGLGGLVEVHGGSPHRSGCVSKSGWPPPGRERLDVLHRPVLRLRVLAEEAGVEGEVRLEHILQFSDVFTTQQQDDDLPLQHWQAVLPALEEAVTALVSMRRQEGETLAVELHNRLDLIETELGEIESAAPLRVTAARERLHQRLADVLGDERIDRDRLEQEIVMIADRLDVTEECVRLHSHLTQFREALSADDAIGRRLNFISQEMNREVNTIGSKANDAEIARRVVVMKEELEKIREQIQNIE